MTMNELKKEIEKIELEILELERDLLLVQHESSRHILQREINVYKHALKEYKKMIG